MYKLNLIIKFNLLLLNVVQRKVIIFLPDLSSIKKFSLVGINQGTLNRSASSISPVFLPTTTTTSLFLPESSNEIIPLLDNVYYTNWLSFFK